MTKKTLDHLALPKTTAAYALQALASARRRWQQMLPGHGPVPAPKDADVSHYVGPEDEIVLGPVPDSPLLEDAGEDTSARDDR